MATAVQVQYRRGSATQVSAFTGAPGEMVVDTTNNRLVIQDGSTAGGWAAAKLSEVQTNTRTQVSDGNYAVQTADRMVAYITLTAARTLSLPAASAFPGGSRLLVVDESGNCSASKTITLSANGTDLIDGASSAVISTAYGYVALECNTANKWTIVDQVASTLNGLQGALTLAATDGAAVSASGTTVSIGGPGGFVNKLRNGTMDVWQRGTSGSVTTSGGYAADGWIILPTGAGMTWAQAGGRLLTKSSLQVTGAASVTDVQIKQRIESVLAACFCSQTITVQAQIYNGTGGAITPKLTVNRPSAQDNYATVTADVNAVSLQSCPASAWTQVSYTFAANAASYNGLEIVLEFGNNFGANTKTVQIAEVDSRVTPGAATGLNANPPPPELRPIGVELPLCQRYYWRNTPGTTDVSFGFGACASTTLAYFFVGYAPMRAAPTFNQSNTSATANFGTAQTVTGFSASYIGPMSAALGLNVASGLTGNALANWIANSSSSFLEASAEL